MRLGLVSDVHGNLPALEAVVADGRARGVDEWWALGDLVAIGPSPVAVLSLLTSLPGFRALAGNTERYVLTGDRPPSPPALRAEVSASFLWTRDVLAAAGWLDWVGALPGELRETLPDGTRLLGVHASPGRDDGPGITADTPADRLHGCDADLVCGGHTHRPCDVAVGDVRAVNLGSVGNPVTGDVRASYVVLHCDARGVEVEHRRVEYDVDRFLGDLAASSHPSAEFIAGHYR